MTREKEAEEAAAIHDLALAHEATASKHREVLSDNNSAHVYHQMGHEHGETFFFSWKAELIYATLANTLNRYMRLALYM